MAFDAIDLQSAKLITTATAPAVNGHNGSFQSARSVYSREKFWTDDIRRELCDLVYRQKLSEQQAADYLGEKYGRTFTGPAIYTQLNLIKAAVKAGKFSVDFDIPIEPEKTGVIRTKEELLALHERVAAEIPYMRRYARALRRDSVAADELVQAVLLRGLAKLHLWQEGTDLRAWLFTILHNQHVNQIRSSVREGVAVSIFESETSETELSLVSMPDQENGLKLRDLDRALGKLPKEQRSIILLVGLEEMRYGDAAKILHIPEGTVRSRLSRARANLRQLMDEANKKPNVIIRGAAPNRPSAALGLTPATRELLKKPVCTDLPPTGRRSLLALPRRSGNYYKNQSGEAAHRN